MNDYFKISDIDNWFLERQGKFTASEVWKLLIGGKAGDLFGPGAMTYIRQKAIESMTTLFERPELEEVKSLLHGKVYEEPAYNEYVAVTKNYSMRYFGTYNPVYLAYNDYSGGSPDGLMGEGQRVDWGLELKCPKDSGVHFEYLKMKDQWDLKEAAMKYYCQIQSLFMITGASGWHFCSFDDRFIDKKKKTKIIEVLPDKKFQDALDIRLQMAEKEKQKIINENFT